MKKVAPIVLILGLILSPLIFRYVFTHWYVYIRFAYPNTWMLVFFLLDVVWIWIMLFGITIAGRLIRWGRNRMKF